jgi:hypothetical protein
MLSKIPWTVRLTVTSGSLLFSAMFSAMISAGCHKKAPVVQVPLVMPSPAPAPVATIPEPVPVSETSPAPVPPTVAINPAPLPPPPDASKPSPFPRVPARPAPVVPAPVIPTPIPAPSLGAILSADERKRLDAEYRADIRQANDVLNSIRGRTLTPSQKENMSRVRDSIRQAAQYHDRDLATAAELARRARVLTQDLAGAH